MFFYLCAQLMILLNLTFWNAKQIFAQAKTKEVYTKIKVKEKYKLSKKKGRFLDEKINKPI